MYQKDEPKIKLAIFPSYLSKIKNSVGSKIFRNLYFKIGLPRQKRGKKLIDVLEDGNLSCAYFASSILFDLSLIKELHTTVKETVKDLERSGWKPIAKLKVGSVLIWEEKYFKKSGKLHKHIGFYIGGGKAISNSSRKGTPVKHSAKKDASDGKPRKIIKILWRKNLR